ncbi:MAG: hypothetical protein K6C69_01810 [Lachnospiraceae bacterium]|nr:hypothetical protein [Lachnospiraceae bacterium]
MELFKDVVLSLIYGLFSLIPLGGEDQVWFYSNLMGTEPEYTVFFLSLLSLSSMLVVMLLIMKDVVKLVIGTYQLFLDFFGNIFTWISNYWATEKKGYYAFDTNPYKRQALLALIATFANCIVSWMLGGLAKTCQTIPGFIAFALLGCAVLLLMTLVLNNGRKTMKKMSFMDAIIIGALMGVGVLPGCPRIVMCFVGALGLRYTQSSAFRFYLFTLIPSTIFLALGTLQSLTGTAITLSGISALIVGMLVCGVTTVISYRLGKHLTSNNKTKLVALVGIILGILLAIVALAK